LDDLKDLKEKATYPIKHVIVLMMENRSFDHVFGWMTRGGEFGDERIDGLYGTECNPRLVNHLWAGYDCVNDKASDICDDPEHGHLETTEQIFGCKSHYQGGNTPHVEGQEDNPCISHASTSGSPTMSGYSDNSIRKHHVNLGQNELTMWASENVPIMTTLAKEFANFDRYFASYPGPTDQNRMFMHSGTCRGSANTGDCRDQECYPQKTIFKLLEENGLDWKLYFEDNPLDWFLYMKDLNQTYVQEGQDKIVQMENFYADMAEGKLPAYTFINPSESVQKDKRNNTHSFGLPNDQHPPHSMREGERLIKNVYESLRNSSRWNDTLLVINFDEHGGFYDHVAPPQEGVPNPDGIMNHYGFNFTRLGVRLPFMLISPWINKNTLVSSPKEHQKPFETS
jgi:phospholipase C